MKETGLILKNYLPIKYKASILNGRGERLEVIASNPVEVQRLRPGYKIAYNLVPSAHFNILSDIEIISIPKGISYENLQFLHLVVELCILIIPPGQIALEVVEVLNIVIESDTDSWLPAQRRLLVCWLLSLVGFYPDLMANEYELVHKLGQINAVTAKNFLEFKIGGQIDVFLKKWIIDFVNANISSRMAALFATIYQN